MHLVVGRDREAVLAARRAGRACAASLRELEEIEACGWCRATQKRPSLNSTLSGGASEHDARRCACPWRSGRRRALRDHGAGVAHRAAGMRAAADLTMSVSPVMMLTRLERHAEPVGDHLREARLVALAARQRADHDVDAAVRLHRDLGALARRADRGLDVVGEMPRPRSLPRFFASRLRCLKPSQSASSHARRSMFAS